MKDYSRVRGAIEALRERIEEAASRAGRDAREVELLAVTKFHPIQAVRAAWEAGIRAFGESRVQEAEEKFSPFLAEHPEARLEMIGHIQSNKAKKAVTLFSRLQSVDSVELMAELDRRARAAGLRRAVLLELHTGEASKEGFIDADALYRALDFLLSMPDRRLEARGLMTMAPNTGDAVALRASFRALRAALEGARSRFGAGLGAFDTLSMGMSGDFEIAVEEGSTLVRIGTGIFGEREP